MNLSRIFKWIAVAFGVLVLLAGALLAYLAFFFDANAYKGRAIEFVAQKYQRTLTIDGDLKLAVFPRIALALPHTSLSERGEKTIAAEVARVEATLELLPLLRKQVRIGEVRLAGLSASVVKGKDGRSNFDDLIGAPAPAASAPETPSAGGGATAGFDIGGIRITDSAIAYRDLAAGRDIALSAFNLEVGRLADGRPVPLDLSVRVESRQPAFAGALKAKGRLLVDAGARHYGADGFTASVEGRFDGQPIEAKAELAKLDWTPARVEAPSVKLTLARGGAQALDAQLVLEALSGKPAALAAKQLALNAKFAAGTRKAEVELRSPLVANVDALTLALNALTGHVKIDDPAMPARTLDLPFTGKLAADAQAGKIDATLDAKLDGAPLAAQIGVAGFAKPAIRFDLGFARLDVDRYVDTGSKPAQTAAAQTGFMAGLLPGAQAAAPAAGETPFDLSALKTLDLDGAARIADLKVHGLKAQQVALKLASHAGVARIAPITGRLYGGTLDASMSADANTNRCAFAPHFTNIEIAPLLRDAAGLDKLEGRGNVALDATAAGNTVGALKRSLAGTASVRLVDGAIVGFDYGKRLADWRGKLSALASGNARNESSASDAREKTAFSELSATFKIAQGVASNSDLAVKAPLVRLGGAGTIDIGRDSLDYTVRASVVNTLSGQGGKSLDQARDVTVPVRVHGPYDKIAYEIQWAAVTSSLLKSSVGEQLDTRKQELKEKAREQLKDKLKGLFSR